MYEHFALGTILPEGLTLSTDRALDAVESDDIFFVTSKLIMFLGFGLGLGVVSGKRNLGLFVGLLADDHHDGNVCLCLCLQIAEHHVVVLR